MRKKAFMARAHRQGSLNQAEMGESELLGIDQCTTQCNFALFKPVRSIGASLHGRSFNIGTFDDVLNGLRISFLIDAFHKVVECPFAHLIMR